MNLGNRFGLGCSTIIFVAAGVSLYNMFLRGSGPVRVGQNMLIIPVAVAVFAAIGIVTTIEKIRREEGDALGHDKWLVILGSFLFTAGASLLALGGLCSMVGAKDFASTAMIGAGMLVVAGVLAYWRRTRRDL